MKVAIGATLAFIASPLIYLLIRTLERSPLEILQLIVRPKTVQIMSTTAFLVLMVVLINVVIATLISTGIYLTNIPYSRLLLVPLTLPLAIPSYVFTYTWIALAGNLSGISAAIFILVLTTLPYPLLTISIALSRLDAGVVEVARTLGFKKREVLFKVIFPQIRGGIGAGAVLSGLYVLSDFGAVSLLNVETLTVSIQNIYRSTYDRSAAATIALILILISLIFVIVGERFKAPETRILPDSRIAMQEFRSNGPIAKTALFGAISLYTTLAVLVPFYVLISRFLTNPSEIDFSNLLATSIGTIFVAFLGALIALVISTPIALLIAQHQGRFARYSERFILLSHALPGIVIGLALVSIASKIGFLYQTLFLLGIAYSLLFLPKAVASSSNSLQRIPESIKEVAQTLGKNRSQIAREVSFPIAAPSIGLGAVLVFLSAMKELPATLMLRPTGFETLATEIWSFASINKFNEAAPYALFLVLIATIPTFILSLKSETSTAERAQLVKEEIDDFARN